MIVGSKQWYEELSGLLAALISASAVGASCNTTNMTQNFPGRRVWMGNLAVLVATLGSAFLFFNWQASPLLWIPVAAVLVVAQFLLFPVAVHAKQAVDATPPSTFIRGNVSNSTFNRVNSEADIFIDGNVEMVRMFDVICRGRKIAKEEGR